MSVHYILRVPSLQYHLFQLTVSRRALLSNNTMKNYLSFVTGLFACCAITTADPFRMSLDKRQDNPFPAPVCQNDANPGFDVNGAVTSLGWFCSLNNNIVKPGSQRISMGFANTVADIRFTLAWNDKGNCPPSQSPTQNDGRDCNTIFHSIVDGCPSDHPMQQNGGGTVTWNCVDWTLGFDTEGGVQSPGTTTRPPVDPAGATPSTPQ